ncbi:hypothetical protein [Bradyrhizobium iriomotense]|uniref:hypothetical protein n=1 Tax=Bradyrhizobium iriomotense TaxID=441950 RepID=UPI001B8A1C9F|nr:hypothetical protein [Bradyrhizobium iriomotense]MBR0787384.1 hypothetical protein [Bradyrhizobium iriomotense]
MVVLVEAFRSLAIARFSAKYPNSAMDDHFVRCALEASAVSAASAGRYNEASLAASAAANTVAQLVNQRKRKGNGEVYARAADAVALSISAAAQAGFEAEHLASIVRDQQLLSDGGASWEQLVEMPLWVHSMPPRAHDQWQSLKNQLEKAGLHWSVWIKWYEGRVLPLRQSTEVEDAAYSDLPGQLSWERGPETVNIEILSRLEALRPDPHAIEGINSPITINRLADGRIGVETGPFSLPTLPASLGPQDHHNALTVCRNRAVQVAQIASSSQFQGRSEYAQILADYLEWLPNEQGSGNMLLADGEARTLNKLFTAEEGILPLVFASKLAVLLEDHIALRSFYPEIERHYQAVNTGRLITPLSRDAVEAVQQVIRSQTPKVFDETVSPAIDEAAKPSLEIRPILEDLPPADPSRPKPPHDPIADADPRKSQNYIVASAYNRIWAILQKGKGTAEAIEGWQKTYDLMKPHMGAIIDFLRNFWPGDSAGGGSLPPTIGT